MSDNEEFNTQNDEEYTNMERTLMGSLKPNDVVMVKGRPCKVISFSSGKVGKHGAAKTIIKCTDIITDKHIEDFDKSTRAVWLPKVTRTEYGMIDLKDGFVTLLNDDGETIDIKLREDDPVSELIMDYHDKGKDGVVITVLCVNNEERIVECKLGK
jgi:translation initiation factor 5A